MIGQSKYKNLSQSIKHLPFLKDPISLLLERRGRRKWKRERNINRLPDGDQTCNPGKCPDQELNQQPYALWDKAQPTEPYQSGLNIFLVDPFLQQQYSLLKMKSCPIIHPETWSSIDDLLIILPKSHCSLSQTLWLFYTLRKPFSVAYFSIQLLYSTFFLKFQLPSFPYFSAFCMLCSYAGQKYFQYNLDNTLLKAKTWKHGRNR